MPPPPPRSSPARRRGCPTVRPGPVPDSRSPPPARAPEGHSPLCSTGPTNSVRGAPSPDLPSGTQRTPHSPAHPARAAPTWLHWADPPTRWAADVPPPSEAGRGGVRPPLRSAAPPKKPVPPGQRPTASPGPSIKPAPPPQAEKTTGSRPAPQRSADAGRTGAGAGPAAAPPISYKEGAPLCLPTAPSPGRPLRPGRPGSDPAWSASTRSAAPPAGPPKRTARLPAPPAEASPPGAALPPAPSARPTAVRPAGALKYGPVSTGPSSPFLPFGRAAHRAPRETSTEISTGTVENSRVHRSLSFSQRAGSARPT